MQGTAKRAYGAWQPEAAGEDENDITQPMRVICSRTGAPRSSRGYWLKKIGESARRQTPDWTEIGGAAPEDSPDPTGRGSG